MLQPGGLILPRGDGDANTLGPLGLCSLAPGACDSSSCSIACDADGSASAVGASCSTASDAPSDAPGTACDGCSAVSTASTCSGVCAAAAEAVVVAKVGGSAWSFGGWSAGASGKASSGTHSPGLVGASGDVGT